MNFYLEEKQVNTYNLAGNRKMFNYIESSELLYLSLSQTRIQKAVSFDVLYQADEFWFEEKCGLVVKHLLEKWFLVYSPNRSIVWKSDSLLYDESWHLALVFWSFPSNMFKIRSVNVLLALNFRAMNQEELHIFCWPSGCEYQQIFPVQFCPLTFILVHFPPKPQMLCLLRTKS